MTLMTACGARKARSESAAGAARGRTHRSTTSACSTMVWGVRFFRIRRAD
jgi:hypothetical protein